MNPHSRLIAQQATSLAKELPHDTVQLVATIVAESSGPPDAKSRLGQYLAHPHYRRVAAGFIDQWHSQFPDVLPTEVALALLTAAESQKTHRGEQSVELVWTGPDVSELPFRLTKQAILEVLNSAEQRITLVSYAVYRIPHIRKALVEAAQRGVQITVVVESPDKHEGQNEYDTLKALGDDVAACSTVYYWPSDKRSAPGGRTGILHVKCLTADSRRLFVSSANLTEHAFTRNMELGVLVRGGTLPGQVERHFEALIARGILARP